MDSVGAGRVQVGRASAGVGLAAWEVGVYAGMAVEFCGPAKAEGTGVRVALSPFRAAPFRVAIGPGVTAGDCIGAAWEQAPSKILKITRRQRNFGWFIGSDVGPI